MVKRKKPRFTSRLPFSFRKDYFAKDANTALFLAN